MPWVTRVLIGVVLLGACGGGTPASPGECGDGVIDAEEACDEGGQNGTAGCTTSCTFACVDPAVDCAQAPACQIATCAPDHTCSVVADASQNGMTCGQSSVCDDGACVGDAACGNGVKEGAEECDFGAGNGAGTGCESDCTFSCANQAACDDANPCNGVETCDAVMVGGQSGQKCAAGTSLTNGASCGTGMICIDDACTAATCGDGYTTSPEECDDANPTAGDGCDNDCTFSCVSTDSTRNCTPADACAGQGTCNDTTHTCTPGTPLDDDTACGSGGYCKAATCTQPMCPNSDPEPGETCDDGNQNNGDGCDNDCTYSCTNPSTDCGTPPACQMFTCSTGHVCEAVANPAQNGTSCGVNGETCSNGVCMGAVCGNGTVEAGETCEPPGSSTCDAACQQITCGDGVRAGSEQCDDGNATNLDGCSATCKFEQCHRMNDLDIQFGTSAYCPQNAFGSAIGNITVLGQSNNPRFIISDAISTGITDGSISVIFQLLDLDDLSGTTDANLSLGVLAGTPAPGAGYSGNNDLDWWYTIDLADLDSSRVPLEKVQGSITGNQLDAGPGNMTFSVNFVAVDVTLAMFNTKVRITTGAATTPLTSSGGSPGHLASEHLLPSLTSFATMGTQAAQGELCGSTTAASLENTYVPNRVVQLCPGYTLNRNTLLDLYVRGCNAYGISGLTVISKTQPDSSRSGTDVYRFQDNGDRVTGCTKNGQPGDLQDCLQNAGYTNYYKFTTDRVIGK